MKRDELKQVLKPLIKQCIKEVIFDDGVLSGIITEIVKGLGAPKLVTEAVAPIIKSENNTENRERQLMIENSQREHRKELENQRQQLTESIGERYNGVDLFEGVSPIGKGPAPSSGPSAPASPFEGVAPDDPGVDISKLGIFTKGR